MPECWLRAISKRNLKLESGNLKMAAVIIMAEIYPASSFEFRVSSHDLKDIA
jgi:hypothetical protein